MFTEAPVELLPREVADAKRMFNACLDGGIPLAEAAERVAKKLGTEKHMPEKLIKDLEKYLGGLKKAKTEGDEPVVKDEPADEPDAEKKGSEQAEGEDEKKSDKDEKPPVITGDEAAPAEAPVAAPVAAPAAVPTVPATITAPVPTEPAAAAEPASAEKSEPEDDDEEEKDTEKKGEKDKKKDEEGDDEEKKDDDDDAEKKDEDDDDGEDKGKKDDDEKGSDKDEANEALGELLRLALAPIGKQWGSSTVESRKAPKSISLLKESTTGVGVSGARDTGVLDVFSYGGYLERALPYLISASMSRFTEEDKAKFVNIYRKFTETNDITEMTKLAGALADVVEWGDATQEGAELVKNLRFMSDFMNVLRGSVDFSKKAFPAI